MILTDTKQYLSTVVLWKVEIQQNQARAGRPGEICVASEKRQRLSPVFSDFEIESDAVQPKSLLDEINVGRVILRQENSRQG